MEVGLILNSIELLNTDLLSDQEKLNEIDHWLKVMNRPQGWHYDMDIIWLLKGLGDAGIKKGATILDAGAGMGITQFLLAANGYNIISLDYSPRLNPPLAKDIFEIEVVEQDNLDYKHDYIGFVDYDSTRNEGKNNKIPDLFEKVLNAMGRGPEYMLSRVKQQFQKKQNKQININEKMRNHNDFGNIKFIRAAFHDMPLKDEEVDALVSVSAIEHADPKLMKQNINEMKRVVKKGNPLLITTSGTGKNKDWFHEKTQGWCYTEKSLKKIAGDDSIIQFNYNTVEENILNSSTWRSRIDPYYSKDSNSEFFRMKMNSLPYLPVGISIVG